MTLVFHERVGFEGRRPSPFSWRIRYALAHKGLLDTPDVEVRPTRFADRPRIEALSGQRFVPVIEHGGRVVFDSWAIACHIEDAFPDRPSLFGGPIGRGVTRALNHWSDAVLSVAVRPILAAEFPAVLDPKDRAYYRSSREAMFGCSLEAFAADRAGHIARLRETVAPLEALLAEQPWIAGAAPAYADHVIFSVFQYARLGCTAELLDAGTALAGWRARMIALHGGLGDRFPGYPAP
ncbi:MAG: glutathione S-transferase N-terminal domain-containing protein [Acetobacteraceae bacterium]|nr:glutathione S-transferase N-terminal domain-containing protein [Acetobacteraceae bacterium]